MDVSELYGGDNEGYLLLLHQAAVGRNWRIVAWIKHVLEVATGSDMDRKIRQVWLSLEGSEQNLLWRAPTKGGCFTVEERKRLREILPNAT
jgi:hypothetical protein